MVPYEGHFMTDERNQESEMTGQILDGKATAMAVREGVAARVADRGMRTCRRTGGHATARCGGRGPWSRGGGTPDHPCCLRPLA